MMKRRESSSVGRRRRSGSYVLSTSVLLVLGMVLLSTSEAFGFSAQTRRSNNKAGAFLSTVGPRRAAFHISSSAATTATRRRSARDSLSVVLSSSSSSTETTTDAPPKTRTKTLGLLTFDLDDTLYPIAPVLDEANAAFAESMKKFGYENIQPSDIVETSKKIRSTLDPAEAAVLTHTQVRLMAIREEMEKYVLEKKLKDTAEDWATQVEALSKVVVDSAKKWTKAAVPDSIVQAVYTAWEMERYHAAERLLYPEVLDVLQQIKDENPGVIIGAVTDGRANPLLMTFTLAPFFDFLVSWEDDQGKRSQFFKELGSAEGIGDLTWIYDQARYKYATLKQAADGMASGQVQELVFPEMYDDLVYIHVGDDLAYDVGGSKAVGAKTILCELSDSYGQTARKRFEGDMPAWSTASKEELENHKRMNEAAEQFVDVRIDRLTQLPEAIQKIVEQANKEE